MKLGTIFILALALILSLAGTPGQAAPPPLPLNAGSCSWRPLSQIGDAGLQAQLEQSLRRKPFWWSLIKSKKMAVGLVDLSAPATPRFARVNGDTMMYGASLPKLAILLAAFKGFKDGSLKMTPAIEEDLKKMIRLSDNQAAGRMVALIGLKKIETLLLVPRHRFYDPARGGGIWLGSGFTAGGERHPDPIQGLTHAATVYQLCRYYYLLAYGKLISPEQSRKMLRILSSPELHDKFVRVLEPDIPLNHMYRKSGEFGVWHADSMLVWAERPWRRYILAAMVENGKGEKVLEDLVPVVERLLQAHPPAAPGLDHRKQTR